jgi:chromosome segregation ATPase
MLERLAATEEGQNHLRPEDRSDDQVRALKLQLEQIQRREQDLRVQEATVSGTLATEQSRWTDINARLDALERSLPGKTP